MHKKLYQHRVHKAHVIFCPRQDDDHSASEATTIIHPNQTTVHSRSIDSFAFHTLPSLKRASKARENKVQASQHSNFSSFARSIVLNQLFAHGIATLQQRGVVRVCCSRTLRPPPR
mmetsp:Transcript_13946/g.29386  ORF Transcript_13946/g.29386 Transcript_13946/m.29386 type:complete len:116 (+) Transcript_13946:69-416(+)